MSTQDRQGPQPGGVSAGEGARAGEGSLTWWLGGGSDQGQREREQPERRRGGQFSLRPGREHGALRDVRTIEALPTPP